MAILAENGEERGLAVSWSRMETVAKGPVTIDSRKGLAKVRVRSIALLKRGISGLASSMSLGAAYSVSSSTP